MFKAIIIDSEKKEIRIEEHPAKANTLEIMQKAVGGYIERAGEIEGNDVFVNDEGLMNGTDTFFIFEGAHQPFAGNGIITATDEEGETLSTTLTVDQVKAKVKFLSLEEIRKSLRM